MHLIYAILWIARRLLQLVQPLLTADDDYMNDYAYWTSCRKASDHTSRLMIIMWLSLLDVMLMYVFLQVGLHAISIAILGCACHT